MYAKLEKGLIINKRMAKSLVTIPFLHGLPHAVKVECHIPGTKSKALDY